MSRTESGNVLFLILIATALFAALTYTVVNSSRSGSTSQQERISLSAGQLIQYPADIRASAMRITIMGNALDTDISFDTGNWGHTNYQHGVPQPDRNKIFSPDGGSLPWQRTQPEWLDKNFSAQPYYGLWLFTGGSCIPGIGAGSDNTCNNNDLQLELVAVAPYITEDICREINKRLGLQTIHDDPPQLIGDAWPAANAEFAGIYQNGEVIIDADGILHSVDTACFEGNGNPPAGSYHVYSTIVQR